VGMTSSVDPPKPSKSKELLSTSPSKFIFVEYIF
jgi:hypothetical protein